ncbi:10768_t:CDS:2 [Paraglomus brasilianum]|uniref:10768_t:CDS:1 n=1 Tax=Paraglomus brasilianum TaxID=144538 RepID=A0A9N9BMK4_9GLOM|nr:10768_t:CDS:2 [Paraglomus brasilianum]
MYANGSDCSIEALIDLIFQKSENRKVTSISTDVIHHKRRRHFAVKVWTWVAWLAKV